MKGRKGLPPYRFFLIGFSLIALTLVYISQQFDYLDFFRKGLGLASPANGTMAFVFNKTLRLVLNDVLCFVLILALFEEKKYLRLAFIVFCFEFFLVLPIYFLVKLTMEGNAEISSPLLSQIHRLIVNPMLMFVLIMGFYYQRFWSNAKK